MTNIYDLGSYSTIRTLPISHKLISHHLLSVNYNRDNLSAESSGREFWPKTLKLWLTELWGHALSLRGHCWRSELIQHFPKGGVNQKHTGGKTGWPLSHCARQRRRERGFPWRWGPNTIPSLSQWHIACGGSHNHVTLCLCQLCVRSKRSMLRHLPAQPQATVRLKSALRSSNAKLCKCSSALSAVLHVCISLWWCESLLLKASRLKLKGDVKCCLKWIRKAAGFIFTHSVTCAAKRKQVTKECVLNL